MNLRELRTKRATAAVNTAKRGDSTEATEVDRLKQAGQIIAIFALMLTAIIGLVGIAIDVTFAWRAELQVQRAADAAALAGVVYLPGNISGGTTASLQEATKNGFTSGSGTSVSAHQDASNIRQMDVAITTPVPTFFVRVFGINSFTVTRDSKAVYILPVPMGSPDPYYGDFGTYKMKNAAGATVTTTLSGPSGQAMASRGFWGSMVAQGSGTSSGDAYEPKKLNANPPSGTNPQRDTADFYDYGIWMPPGSTSGHVWLFDPVFCDTDNSMGTGEGWLYSQKPMSSIFKLYNTNNQPYNLAAHTYLGSSGSFFTNMNYYDPLANGANASGSSSCSGSTFPASDPRSTHMKWWDLSSKIGGDGVLSGGPSGTTYRLRTTSDPGDSSQDTADGYNNFAIYVEATGATPQVYGIGAMQMYTPLPGGSASVFYLAQIDAQAGAGKTMEVMLWDAGDTNALAANLQILQPTSGGWSAVSSMTWTGTKVSGDASTCPSGSGSSIVTNSGGSSKYNGCWLTIDIVIPASYSAPQSGWWKIQYNMSGASTDYASDETTWQVNIRGNPVHLIPS
jgi:hypothetical protein